MNNLRKRIHQNYMQLTDTNKLIANAVLSFDNMHFDLNLVTLAKLAYCSNSAITKFINQFGYKSYKVFVNDLNSFDAEGASTIKQSIDLVDQFYISHRGLVDDLINAIRNTNKVYIFATGQSQLSAIDFSLKGNKKENGKYIFESNTSTQELLIHTLSPDDVIIFISNSGESRELTQFIKDIQNEHMFLVSNRDDSTLSKQIKQTINLNNTLESPFTFKEFSRESKYTLLYFFDCLFDALYQ